MSKLRTPDRRAGRARRVIAVVVGVPVLLYSVLGSPIPTGLPTSIDQLHTVIQNSGDGTLLIGLFTYVSWFA